MHVVLVLYGCVYKYIYIYIYTHIHIHIIHCVYHILHTPGESMQQRYGKANINVDSFPHFFPWWCPISFLNALVS